MKRFIPRRFARKALLLLTLAAAAWSAAATSSLARDKTQFSPAVLPERYSLFQSIEQDRNPESTSAVSRNAPPVRSYLIPGLEITASVAALNGFNRVFLGKKTNGGNTSDTNLSSIWNNLFHQPWDVDDNKYITNQLGHPYQGAIYQNIARSTGFDFWESSGFTFLGSILWEVAGETTNPSINDHVASGIGGNFLGEPLYRMASLMLEDSRPGFWRELGAAVISPPTGFNRYAFGERFDAVFPSRKPACFWHLDLGADYRTHRSGPAAEDRRREGAIAGFSMEYGLPGKPGYHYSRPFDYFRFEAIAATNYSSAPGYLSTRGLLFGKEYSMGDPYKGIWGLYGSYDYITSDPARVSTTALSCGTTAQWRLSPGIALQGTFLGGLGYGAGGEISGVSAVGERKYHYGGTAQGVLDLRLIFGDLAILDFNGRHYYISDVAGSSPHGTETVTRLRMGLTLRMHERHAVGLRYEFSHRDPRYGILENRNQETGMISLVYTFLSEEGFGAVSQ